MRVKRHEPRTSEGGGERVNTGSANCQSSGGRRIKERERAWAVVQFQYETRYDSHEIVEAENAQRCRIKRVMQVSQTRIASAQQMTGMGWCERRRRVEEKGELNLESKKVRR
jgi:hypothetical protein